MGSALDYYMNSLTINGNKATANQVSYDETKHVLKIIIPDEKKVVLEYEATINLPVGEDSSALNETNAYNKCSLKGIPNQSELETYVSLKGKVLESSGASEPESRRNHNCTEWAEYTISAGRNKEL